MATEPEAEHPFGEIEVTRDTSWDAIPEGIEVLKEHYSKKYGHPAGVSISLKHTGEDDEGYDLPARLTAEVAWKGAPSDKHRKKTMTLTLSGALLCFVRFCFADPFFGCSQVASSSIPITILGRTTSSTTRMRWQQL
eukprot:SAG11_NODE_5878_length_1442_cov_4.145942_2_plen_137_part_00